VFILETSKLQYSRNPDKRTAPKKAEEEDGRGVLGLPVSKWFV